MVRSASRSWLVALSAIAVAGCAVADVRPGIVRHETPKQIWQRFHGPGVRIRANVVNSNDSRVIEPVVYLSDSAYLVIGDIGDDGTMRIVYPARPGEQNFVKKQWSFEGPRFQPRIVLPFMPTAFSAARTAPGYAFAIASSIPLDLSKLTEGERWAVFDVMHDNYMNDPRAAITDLVTAISSDVGQVSISYAAYSWGFVGTRSGVADRSTALPGGRRRLPRPPQ
jgi:hypothetical protein